MGGPGSGRRAKPRCPICGKPAAFRTEGVSGDGTYTNDWWFPCQSDHATEEFNEWAQGLSEEELYEDMDD